MLLGARVSALRKIISIKKILIEKSNIRLHKNEKTIIYQRRIAKILFYDVVSTTQAIQLPVLRYGVCK
jgi:hypothetical protein